MATPKRGRPTKHQQEPDKTGRTGVPFGVRVAPGIYAGIPLLQAAIKAKLGARMTKTQIVEMGLLRLYAEFGITVPEGTTPPEKTP